MKKMEEFCKTKYYIQQDKAIDKVIFEWQYDAMLKNTGLVMTHIPKEYRDDFGKWAENRTGYGKRYMMITVNFKPEATLDDMKYKIKKCLKKCWIEQYMYCYEVRNEDLEGVHVHIKIWKAKGKKSGECKREVYNTFKHVVGNKAHVNMRHSNIEGCFEKYIKGFKNDEEKECVPFSRDYRDQHGLDDIYKS